MGLQMQTEFRTRLLASSWFIPVFVSFFGIPLIAVEDVRLIGVVILGLAVTVAVLRIRSQIVVEGSQLETRFFGVPGAVDLSAVVSIRSRPSKASLFIAPALEIIDARGGSATVRLGWWHSEPSLLRLISDAVTDRDVEIDDLSQKLLRIRPSGESWDLRRK
jgi:hypothetical protein